MFNSLGPSLLSLLTGMNCTEDDPCLPRIDCPEGYLCYGPCDPNIVCIGATGLPHCRGCVPGYTGIKCDEDVDECRGQLIIQVHLGPVVQSIICLTSSLRGPLVRCI